MRLFGLLITLGLIFAGGILSAQDENPYRLTDCRIRVGRVLCAEVSEAPPFIPGYSNVKTEPKIKIGETEVNANIAKPATVALSFVPNAGRSLSLYDYQIEYLGKLYRCVGMSENWTRIRTLIDRMNESKIYTLYFIVPAPDAALPQIPMTLVWTLNQNLSKGGPAKIQTNDFALPDRRVLSIVNRRGAPLTPPQTLVKEKDDYLKLLSGSKDEVEIPVPVESIPFNKSPASEVRDSKGKVIGTLVSGARFDPDGVRGDALDLTNGYAQIEPGKIFYGRSNLGSDYSLVLWLKIAPAMRDDNVSIYAHGAPEERENSVNIKLKSGNLIVKVNAQTAVEDNDALFLPANFIADNKWHMIAVTVSRAGGQVLFLDGNSTASRLVRNESIGTISQPLVLGMNSRYAPASKYRGSIDELAFYDLSLSPGQVRAIYQTFSKNLKH